MTRSQGVCDSNINTSPGSTRTANTYRAHTNTPMSRLHSHRQTTTPAPSTPAPAPFPDARKLANKQRRTAGRERHEEHKDQLRWSKWDRRWEHLQRDRQRQSKRREDYDGTRAFTGRSFDNQRVAASHIRATDDIGTGEQDGGEKEQEQELIPQTQPEMTTSGAMLLAMARPAKIRRGHHDPPTTDGEAFEVVEVDGRFVALDEDGWEILPDENAEAYFLYSDIVRGAAR
ncbi:hypothetical protein BJV74DRAFT_552694 [Russula compacta]|nr:hypothetical protein BJV74DRAFT_552694 [Russula compacta]